MLQLPNGCYCSNPTIHPKDWNKAGASLAKDWYIQYYFHDPVFKAKFPKGRLTIVKGGINRFKTLAERRAAAKLLLDEEISMLTTHGYNPITGQISQQRSANDVDPSTPFLEALQVAMSKLKVDKSTASDLRSVLNGVKASAGQLRILHVPVGQISRKHIKSILEHQSNNNPRFTANRYNKYRAYLMMLFSELIELEAVLSNPLREIKKQKTIRKQRAVLTIEERKRIDAELKVTNYNFWRFIHIFFHSGGREKELLRLQAKDVDIVRQQYKILVKKGREYREDFRTIKTVALPLWEEAIEGAAPDQYVFAKGLLPGDKPIDASQITRRWRTHVKEKLGIKADFYSLKHLNLDETAAALDLLLASKMAGHTTPVITMQHYALGEKERIHQRLKEVRNQF